MNNNHSSSATPLEPVFSVIIPTYNAASTVCRAIDSVLAQSFSDFELIVVDDASTDATVALIAERYQDRVQVIQKMSNYGSSVARNTGMNAAKGRYCAFLDADDAWHADKLGMVFSILAANEQVQFFFHPFSLAPILDKAVPDAVTLYRLPLVKLLPSNQVATSCMVVRNRPEIRFETTMRYTEDFDLAIQAGYKYGIYFIDVPLTQIYRPFTTAGGISANRWLMRKGEMRAYTRLLKLNLLFLPLLPVLWLSSLGKHLYKMVRPS